tara:strand:+ start:392 stop:1078 length:687 start_codon:yes stop_codon:yes gene_type:complete
MNNRIRVSFLSFLTLFMTFPFLSGAEEVNEDRVIGGDVFTGQESKLEGYYDIYQRQLIFLKKTSDFSKSIEKRREAYAKPQQEAIESYRGDLEDVFEEQSREYQRELAREQKQEERDKRREELRKKREAAREKRRAEVEKKREERRKQHESGGSATSKEMDKKSAPEEAEDKEAKNEAPAEEEKMAQNEQHEVTEKEMPAVQDEDGSTVDRKVIMPDDAPDFDSNPFD